MERLRRAFSAWCDDARRSRRFVVAHLDAAAKKRRKKREEKSLALAYRALGDRAKETAGARERKSFGSVEADEERLKSLQGELAARTEAEEAARRKLAERTAVREREIGELDAAWRCRQEEHRGTKDALARYVRRMRDLDEDLERPAEKRKLGLDCAALRAELEGLRPGRAAAEEEERKARAARDARREELDRERAAWKEEEAALTRARKAAGAARDEAEERVREASAALDGSLQDLGKSVALAGMEAPELAAALATAKGHLRAIEALAEGIETRRREAASVRRETVRFSLVTGGTLAVLALLVVLLFTRGGGGTGPARSVPDPVAAASASAASAAGSADASAPDDPAAAAPAALTDEVRAAVLALPVLAPRGPADAPLFRATGALRLLSATPAAGGATELRVDADAESRPTAEADFSPVTVHVRVVVDAAGRPIDVTTLGSTAADDGELDRLLEDF